MNKLRIDMNEVQVFNKELRHLLSEANTLLDEIEVTINKMFAAALKAQKT